MSSICKTSSYGENRSALRRSSRQEENMLQKKLSLMRSMRRQSESKLGLETKAVTKRIKNNLMRSTHTDSRITTMKRSMAPANRRHYRIKEHSTAEILKDAWNNDNSKARISAMICTVILPTALRLIEEHNMKVSKEVRLRLDDLQRAHRHYSKRPATVKMTRSKSLADFQSSTRSRVESVMANSTSSIDQSCKEDSLITASYITTSEFDLPVRRTIRSHTLKDIGRDHLPKAPQLSRRPSSAPGKYYTGRKRLSNPTITSAVIREQELDQMLSSDSTVYLNSSLADPLPESSISYIESIRDPDEDFRDEYDENMNCCLPPDSAIHILHAKVHRNIESVTLADVHKALVLTKNYQGRLEALVESIQKWTVTEDEAENTEAVSSSKID